MWIQLIERALNKACEVIAKDGFVLLEGQRDLSAHFDFSSFAFRPAMRRRRPSITWRSSSFIGSTPASADTLSSDCFTRFRNSFAARSSPCTDLLPSCFTVASSLVIVRTPRGPFTRNRSRLSLRTMVARFLLPLGLPFGLPETPFWNRLSCGGLP